MKDRIIIRRMRAEEKAAALDFAAQVYQKRFQTQPRTLSGNSFLAFSGKNICGLLSLQFVDDFVGLDLAKNFAFDFNLLGVPANQTVLFSRWIATEQEVAGALVKAACRHALEAGKQAALACSKPSLLQHLRNRYLFRFDEFYPQIIINNISPNDLHFYQDKPLPCIYAGKLRQWYDVLK